MARPKGPEETFPIHTRLSASQLAGFREYLRKQQQQIQHTGMQLTDAAVLRGMVLRCLDLEHISHGAQRDLFAAPAASIAPVVAIAVGAMLAALTATEQTAAQLAAALAPYGARAPPVA
jgi:lysylphosphatidylglycerol synthetase-like protein (DUF2156 family)